jgi:hypothetical protein
MPSVPTLAALLALGAALSACPSDGPDDAPPEPSPDPTPAPFDPSAYDVLSGDLSESDGTASANGEGENVFHVERFWTGTPLRIVAVEAMWNVRDDDSEPAHLAIWPDEGHNFYDFLRETPYVEWELELDPDSEDDVWILLELDEPIDLPWPTLVYAGTHYTGEDGQPGMRVDGEVTLDPFLQDKMSDAEWHGYTMHSAVFPDRGTDTYGFEQNYFAGNQGEIATDGDLMLRLYVERYDVVEDTWFHEAQGSLEDGASGLQGAGTVSFADCNGDGWMDVWNGRLQVNQGDGTFVDTTDSSGITTGGSGAWGDYDNDGDADLFLAEGQDQLYQANGDCTFTNVTAASGIDDAQSYDNGGENDPSVQNVPTPAAAWVDVNGDGRLDLYAANFGNFDTNDWCQDRLWINEGGGVFSNGTDAWGIGASTGEPGGLAGRGVAPADWDNDGDMDVYVSNYRLQRNLAWRNDGDGFVAIRDTGLEGHEHMQSAFESYYGHTIGSVWGDVDNDGDLDLFAANLAHPRFITFSDKSMFMRNLLAETGAADFEDIRDAAGMIYQETDSSPLFLDYDLDGDLDLFYTTVYPARPSYLYENTGAFAFRMVSYPAGTWIWGGWGVAAADIDNDGDEDIYGGKLLQNDLPAPGNFVKVEAVGSGDGATNRSGIGARIVVTTEAATQTREVGSGIGTGCQAPFLQTIGIGEAATAELRVEFPLTGTVVEGGTVDAGHWYVVGEDGTVGER